MLEFKTKLMIPRGDASNSAPFILEMQSVYEAESRLPDVRIANPGNMPELMGTFNTAANVLSNYIGKVNYELLLAQQHFDKRKAVIILDEMPDKVAELKEKGVKGNEDIREALIVSDTECFMYRDRVDCLRATIILLEGKIKSFVRAFNAVKYMAELKRYGATSPHLTTGSIVEHNISDEFDLSFGKD